MTGIFRHSLPLRALFAAMVALVLAARLFSPAGFMPVATAHGVMVTLCTGQGAMKVLVDREQTPGDRSHDHDAPVQEHCPFAGTAATPALPALAAMAVALPVWHLPTGPIAIALRTGWIARLAAPPPPASGPPATLD